MGRQPAVGYQRTANSGSVTRGQVLGRIFLARIALVRSLARESGHRPGGGVRCRRSRHAFLRGTPGRQAAPVVGSRAVTQRTVVWGFASMRLHDFSRPSARARQSGPHALARSRTGQSDGRLRHSRSIAMAAPAAMICIRRAIPTVGASSGTRSTTMGEGRRCRCCGWRAREPVWNCWGGASKPIATGFPMRPTA